MGDIAQRGNRLTFARGLHVKREGVGRALRGRGRKGRGKDVPTHPADIRPEQDVRRSHRKPATGAPTHPDDLRPKQEPRLRRFGGGRTNLLEELGRVEAEPSNKNRRAEISRVHGELNRGYKTGGRVGKAVGSLVHAATKAAKKYYKKKKLAEDTKKGKFPETESLTHQVGPYVGDVGSEGKKAKKEVERAGAKKGGKADKKWIQKAVNPKHKGYCTPMTKKTCTPARKALARTFKKKAKTGW